MEENAWGATRKATHSTIKIKILLAYLEKILYLWAVGECGGKEKKLALGKRRAQDTNTAEYRRKSGHLCWMTSNLMNDALNPNMILNPQGVRLFRG